VCGAVLRLLQSVPDVISIRKELIAVVRNVLPTPFRWAWAGTPLPCVCCSIIALIFAFIIALIIVIVVVVVRRWLLSRLSFVCVLCIVQERLAAGGAGPDARRAEVTGHKVGSNRTQFKFKTF
jgi:hypothetical protein